MDLIISIKRIDFQPMGLHSKKDLEDRRKHLKREMTDAERVLWSYLRRRSLKNKVFRRQHSIGSYIVDFYCHEEKLIIEIDGDIHLDETQNVYDKKRTSFFINNGYRELRFYNWEIFMHISKVLLKIESYFHSNQNES